MLLQLNIKNFALIEELSISFERGFNVLSGETGAGKSIIIDAINYVLGGKFNKELIRTGENKTFVEAIFTLENEMSKEELIDQNIEYEDWIIVSRESFQSGKSITKVNGRSILISQLKKITETLLDIHGQHENQNLLDSSNHINYLDYFQEKKIKKSLKEYNLIYEKIKDIEKKIKELSGQNSDREKIVDFLKFQIEEINGANLKEEEEKELEEKFKLLSNSEKFTKVLNYSYEVLKNGEENGNSVIDTLDLVIRELASIEKDMNHIEKVNKSLENIYYVLEENINEIRNLKDNIYYDEEELNIINSRLYQIGALKKKYAPTIFEILEYKDKLEKQYEELVHSEKIIEELNKKRTILIKDIKKIALELHAIREEGAIDLEQKVKKELDYIGLEKSTFRVSVELREEFKEQGMDGVQFLISTNPGEPLKPLEKIVSGGELSRIMLALKTVFVDKDKIPSVIFDEIDTGISGRVAQSVAEKMYSISQKHQVFCVTHLPQISCFSDTHYLVSKKVKENKTYTIIEKLDSSGKNEELAKMIGGSEVTDLTLKHAEEMIFIANKKKESLKI
ncbi:DNA repair protein RecN [Clostridium tetani]|uniref:DNA repair protein RecN n=1 Tax=Clostridium tetani (strain Massachusetts / E88) TaxID=212717 RepID=Q894H4_CLOTE|nr:DNA repair protein RecN [Clostridium tetani]AAO36118.1 DNA repair protein recN [Clostridium tetani E88]KGI37926.1 DNA recombination protein RecN [Clostridium tetani]KGI39853.1 DNA recombination protein RecN [Clostridium tetani ATCC 9441]KGI45351.1 DNA recombination protein RecN [Clostridium tetani]KHO31658.1 DNA recombination protein RecN [Clostridium tetani]